MAKKEVMLYKCPECSSTEVILTHEQAFMANTLKHYCHSVKVQDSDSKSRCLECGWEGRHDQLVGYDDIVIEGR